MPARILGELGDRDEVTIRKIENGWIISKTTVTEDKDGHMDWKTKEYYSEEKPDLKVEMSK